MHGSDLRRKHRHNESALALARDPCFISPREYRGEPDLHTELVCPQQQIGQQRARAHLIRELDQDAESEILMDQRLPDIQDASLCPAEDLHQRMRHSHAVVSGDVDKQNL